MVWQQQVDTEQQRDSSPWLLRLKHSARSVECRGVMSSSLTRLISSASSRRIAIGGPRL